MDIAASIVVVLVSGLFAAMALAPVIAELPVSARRRRRSLSVIESPVELAEADDRPQVA